MTPSGWPCSPSTSASGPWAEGSGAETGGRSPAGGKRRETLPLPFREVVMSRCRLALLLLLALVRGAVAAPAHQWLVVTAPAFRSALGPLCAHRRAQGLRVVVVQTTDVL